MTSFDDPNRQAVGQPPIWTGAGEAPEAPEGTAAKSFDPGAHTVAEVQEYLEKHPGEADAALAAEAAGKNRATLTGG